MQSRPWVTSLMVLATLGGTACGDSTGPSPSVTLSVATAAVTLTQGATQVVNVTIGRENFDKPVTLAVEGTLPAGITAVLTQTSLAPNQTTTFLTISATGNATPANVTLAIIASGEGVASQTQPLTVSVTLRGNYTLGTAGQAVMATDGAASAIVTLARTGGNTSDVALVASGVPAGVTAAFAQSPVSGNGVTLRFTASGAPAPGTYPVTVTGSAVGFSANQTTTVQLQVIAAPARTSTSIPVCTNSLPLWFAYQNEGYAWQRVTPSGTDFTFDVTEKVSVVFVRITAGVTETWIYSLTRSELALFTALHCSASRSHTVTVSSVPTTQSALLTMDTASVLLSSATPSFSFSGLPSRPVDLIAVRGTVSQNRLPSPDRVIIRRAIVATAPASLPVLDFAAAESFAPTAATVTFTNALVGGFLTVASTLRTAAFTDGLLQVATPAGSSVTVYGVPGDRLATGDVQETYLYAETASELSGHGVVDYTRAPVDRAMSFGPQLQAPAVSLLSSAPYAMFRGTLAAQAEYGSVVRFTYCQGTNNCTRLLRHVITPGHLGAVPATWESIIPDFTGTAGFDPAWMMTGGAFTPYLAEAFSGRTGLVFGDMPVEGDLYRFAFLESSLSSSALRASLRQGGAAPPRLGPQYLRR